MITIQPEIEILSTESYEDMLLPGLRKRKSLATRARCALEKALQRKFIAGITNAAMNPSLSTAPITVKVTVRPRRDP